MLRNHNARTLCHSSAYRVADLLQLMLAEEHMTVWTHAHTDCLYRSLNASQMPIPCEQMAHDNPHPARIMCNNDNNNSKIAFHELGMHGTSLVSPK